MEHQNYVKQDKNMEADPEKCSYNYEFLKLGKIFEK